MEVKSIFADTIMKSYKEPGGTNRQEKSGAFSDTVSISPQATKRFFEEIMSHSLQKSLKKDITNEGD
ncbi:MAG: hypothetical protein J7L53_01765 [Deltaproteobacteria bacterium]|nr:hypothetical protein [Deltaproteobacteria bacterium]